MTNIYFPDEEVTVNDLYFVCYGGAYCPSVEAAQQICGEYIGLGISTKRQNSRRVSG